MSQAHVFSERQCGGMMQSLYGPEVRDFAGYSLELTIIYTHGVDNNWRKLGGSSGRTSGRVAGAFLDRQAKKAAGAALIDLVAIYKTMGPRASFSLSTNSIRTSKMSFSDYRFQVLAILAHEMFHFIQHWRAGDHLDDGDIRSPFSKAYSETYRAIRQALENKNPKWSDERLDRTTHHTHPREKEAEQMAGARIAKYRREINKGLWDGRLPLDGLRKVYDS